MRRFATGLLMVMAMTVLTSCFIEGPVPYTYSPVYCSGCWHGTWEGRYGWHYGGGRTSERAPQECALPGRVARVAARGGCSVGRLVWPGAGLPPRPLDCARWSASAHRLYRPLCLRDACSPRLSRAPRPGPLLSRRTVAVLDMSACAA